MKLREYLMTFFVHELASPLTALANTLVLCQEDNSFFEEGKGILKESSNTLLIRLKFFRALWGIDNHFASTIGDEFLKTYRHDFEVKGEVLSKIHLGCILLALRILPFAGSIEFFEKRVVFKGKEIRNYERLNTIFNESTLDITQDIAVLISLKQQLEKENKRIKVTSLEKNTLIIDIIS